MISSYLYLVAQQAIHPLAICTVDTVDALPIALVHYVCHTLSGDVSFDTTPATTQVFTIDQHANIGWE